MSMFIRHSSTNAWMAFGKFDICHYFLGIKVSRRINHFKKQFLKNFTRKYWRRKKGMELIKHMNAELTWYTWQWSTESLNYGMPKVIYSSRSVFTFSFMWVIDVELLWERTHCTSRCDKTLLCSQWFLCHAPSQRKAKWPVSDI